MRRENALKHRQDSGLPIDQRSITIKGKDLEAVEVEHGGIISDPHDEERLEKESPPCGGTEQGGDDVSSVIALFPKAD